MNEELVSIKRLAPRTNSGRAGKLAAAARLLPTMLRGSNSTCSKIMTTQPRRSLPITILIMPTLHCHGNAPETALAGVLQ